MLLELLTEVASNVKSTSELIGSGIIAPTPKPTLKWDFDEGRLKVEMEDYDPFGIKKY